MQKSKPFARAIAMLTAIAALPMALRSNQLAMRDVAGEYRSRGKGKGLHSGKKWGPTSSNRNMHYTNGRWLQIENGARERLRRQRQMGTLSQVEVA